MVARTSTLPRLSAGSSSAQRARFEAAQLVGQAEAPGPEKRLLTERISRPRRRLTPRDPRNWGVAAPALRWRIRSCCKLAWTLMVVGCDPAIIRVLPDA